MALKGQITLTARFFLKSYFVLNTIYIFLNLKLCN